MDSSQRDAGVRAAREATAQSAEKYRLLFDSIDEGFCIIEVLFDENEKPVDYRFLEINARFEEQTGIRNAAGRRVREFAPEHEALWFEIYGRIALTGEPERFESPAAQFGHYYDVYAFRVGEPGERRVAVLFKDISDRKRVEDQLRESEERNRDLIRYAPTGIYEIDVHTGRFRSINDAMCQTLGYTRKELLAISPFDLLDDAGKARLAERMRRTLAGEPVDTSVEYRVIRKDGSAIYAVLNTKIIYRDGQPDTAFVIAHDVTERRRAAEELRLAAETLERRVQERTAELKNLSHRLVEGQESERSLVANELYNDEAQRLAALLLELGQMEKTAGSGGALEGHIHRMKHLVQSIIADMHTLAVTLRPASLDRLGLMTALRGYARELGARDGIDVQVAVSGPQDVPLAPDCETMVYRIAQEAITNAVRHSGARQIGIVATRQGGRLVLVIEDDGRGFDVAEATRDGGLGIVGMRERAEMLGGRLTIESAPGKGTAVYIEVPQCNPQPDL